MSPPRKIKINQFQLAILLNDEQKEIYKYIIEHNVFCVTCSDTVVNGIVVNEMILDHLNDIYVI